MAGSLPKRLKKAAIAGGKRFVELYGNPGTPAGRSKGGKRSWQKRRSDPDIYKKYVNTPKRPKDSNELAEFIGIVLGDGSITEFQCTIYLNSDTDRNYAKFVVRLIKQLFALRATISKHKTDHVLRIVTSSVELVRFLIKKGLVAGHKVRHQVDVPKWILKNRNFTKACLRGLIDTDGCFAWHRYFVNGKEYSYPKIIFSNRSKRLLEFVHCALELFGFHPKQTRHHQVWLYNKKEALRYLKVVGTRNFKESFFNNPQLLTKEKSVYQG